MAFVYMSMSWFANLAMKLKPNSPLRCASIYPDVKISTSPLFLYSLESQFAKIAERLTLSLQTLS